MGASALHVDFLDEVFEKTVASTSFSDPLEALLCSEFVEISQAFDRTQIQDSWSWRNTHISRELVAFLIDDKGEFKRRALMKTLRLLEHNAHSLGPNRHHDRDRMEHLLATLKRLSTDQDLVYTLKRISAPAMHQGAQQLIRDTLLLPDTQRITDAHTRRAVLSALFTLLRQNVGSCFATAPAIMIQQDQPRQFLDDMGQLLGTGRLTRIYEGDEYTVPLSVDWGVGDLFRPISFASLGDAPLDALASSPGLRAAFEATGLLERNASGIEKQKALVQLLQESAEWIHEEDFFGYFTPETLLKQVLLKHHGVTEDEVKHFREKPIEGFVGEILVQTPHMRPGKGRVCELFMQDYERAQKAFKALTDNPLLKAWEFTLASLSESKADFAKWNLYSSLGIQPEEPHGIGQSIQSHLQEQVDRINSEIEEFQSRYDHLFSQAKYLEGRIRRASTPNELEWLRADYRIRQQELNRALSERDEVYEKGRRLVNLFPFMVDFYGTKIREYFQEVYDAQMHDVSANPYDDSPAGFRLLYKHGRSNTALWTMIRSPGEYIQYLSSFFTTTEIEMRQLPQIEGIEKELSHMVTEIIATIKRPDFLEHSIYRLARAYGEPLIRNPLENLAKVKRKPWAYISGGTMATLVNCYYGHPNHPKEEKRWVESENELLAFWIDTLKELPLSVQKLYQADSNRSLLAFSPTHAFLCKPGWKRLKDAWESDLYTYTWIRDLWHHPQLNFLDRHILDGRMMDYLVNELLHFIPSGYRPMVKTALRSFPFSMRSNEFREHVLKTLSYEKWLKGGRALELIGEEIDSILFRSLPLFPEHALKKRLQETFEAIDDIDDMLRTKLDKEIQALEVGRYKIFSAVDLRKIAKGLLMQVIGSSRSEFPFHDLITEAMRTLHFAYPEPILVADTNWVKNTFGFTVNPGTGNLDFWRFDLCGSEGRPMSIWRRYLNGFDQKQWGLYTAPSQYGQFL